MNSPTRVAIEVLLQQARHLGCDRDECRELVQREHRRPPRLGPEASEERRPLGVPHAIEPWDQASNLGREACPLEGALAVVGDVVYRAGRTEHLAQEARFSAPSAAIENAECTLAARDEPPQP